MRRAFWAAAFLIAYTYAGYAGRLRLRTRLSLGPVVHVPREPYVSNVMVLWNEEQMFQRPSGGSFANFAAGQKTVWSGCD